MNSLLVFCSSRLGNLPFYAQQAQEVGETLAQRNLTLIYGAGKVGLMGILADAALDAGGKVIGVIPQLFETRRNCPRIAHRTHRGAHHARPKVADVRAGRWNHCLARRFWHHGRTV